MNSWIKDQLTKLYNAVSVPVVATRNALTERLITEWWRIWAMDKRH